MTLDVLVAHEGAREAVLIALQLPAPLGKLLVQYLAMFRPGKRQLSWERVGTILGELRGPIERAQIERNGRAWPAPLDYWKAALEHMVQLRDAGRLQLPLKSHGYLLEVIVGMAHKAEGKAEAGEHARRAGITPVGTHASHQPAMRIESTPGVPMPEAVKLLIRKTT
ncbi:MAG: hypothetical protein K8F93_14605 [Burkholderiales bacterium]|nr:hypothetical protein [Burkholderiales bacterium]